MLPNFYLRHLGHLGRPAVKGARSLAAVCRDCQAENVCEPRLDFGAAFSFHLPNAGNSSCDFTGRCFEREGQLDRLEGGEWKPGRYVFEVSRSFVM